MELSVRPADAPSSPQFVELVATTNFTFLCGASHPEELIAEAAALGYHALGIADTNTLGGIVRAHVAGRDAGVRCIVGSRLVLDDPRGLTLALYPTDRAAYGRLCRLLTLGKRRAGKGECRLALRDVGELNAGLLAVVLPGDDPAPEALAPCVAILRDIFDDDRLSIAGSVSYGPRDRARLEALARLGVRSHVPLLGTNDVLYHVPRRRPLQDVLTCIRLGTTLEKAGYALLGNAERHLKAPAEMARLFAEHPQALRRSVEIAERTRGFTLDQLRYEYPDEVCPPGRTPMEHLRDLAWSGAKERYPGGVPEKVRAQIGHELALIEELRYAPYFLTVHDIVRFARARAILCQGRGAAANSAVCYCLGVTSVDPARISLLFERFVSRERDEPPDIDIDFEHERREEVIQYIYAKYGRERAALTAEVISYRGKSAIREVGKAMGLSLDCVDRLARTLSWWDHGEIPGDRLRELGLDPGDRTLRLVLALTAQVQGFPRHRSQHVGGFVITRGPLCESVPIENAAMDERTIIEWDKDDLDAMGMLKVDCLGLGMLTCIRKCMDMINAEVARCRGAEVARDSEGGPGTYHSNTIARENARVEHQLVSGSDRLAEEQGVVQAGLQGNGENAQGRDLRAHVADATGRGLDPVEHRGGLQPQDAPGAHPRPADRERIAGRTLDAMGDRGRAGTGALRSDDGLPAGGDRSHAIRPDPPSRERTAQEMIRFLAPRHCGTSTPRHLGTSAPFLQLHTIPPEDPATYDMICKADTVGVFQIESRAQMSMLPRLRPRNFYDLVIEVAIVRPGPIQGDMVHPYLRRRQGLEPVVYPGDAVRGVLERTLGVPLFQEQVMALSIAAGGFTPGQADQLRRAMAAWKRQSGRLEALGRELVAGMLRRGYAPEFADRCFEQIKGFGEYGFPESHAASFALLVYVSAWLKCHHPAAFTAALINSQPMDFYAPAQIVRDAKEHGVVVRPIDANHSDWDCTLEEGGAAVRLGMRLIAGLGEECARAIVRERQARGAFASAHDLRRRCAAPSGALRALARADAFVSMGLDRQRALWALRAARHADGPLFDAAEIDERGEVLPGIAPPRLVQQDYRATGLSLRAHPVSFLRRTLEERGAVPARQIADPRAFGHGKRAAVGGIVLVRQRPGTASGVVFITLEDETGIVNLVLWSDVFERFRAIARLSVAILALGRVERAGEVVHLHVSRLESLDPMLPPWHARSRDFH